MDVWRVSDVSISTYPEDTAAVLAEDIGEDLNFFFANLVDGESTVWSQSSEWEHIFSLDEDVAVERESDAAGFTGDIYFFADLSTDGG